MESGADTDRVTVIVSRGTEDERTTSPLEIVRGDRLRIGATHWEKQLFNGTVVTVEDFKVERGEAGTEPSVLISGHTEDGRKVSYSATMRSATGTAISVSITVMRSLLPRPRG